jgi:hypothetical protein
MTSPGKKGFALFWSLTGQSIRAKKNSCSKTEVAIFEFNSFFKQAVQLPIALQDSGP